jgi:DNA-binding NtrC family response regulator
VLLGDLHDHAAPDARAEAEPEAFDPSVPFRVAKDRAVSAWEQKYLAQLLAHAEGNVSKAARLVRMDRNHLRELLRRHRLGRG